MNWTTDGDGMSTVAIAVDGEIVNTITSPCLVEEIGKSLRAGSLGSSVSQCCTPTHTGIRPPAPLPPGLGLAGAIHMFAQTIVFLF